VTTTKSAEEKSTRVPSRRGTCWTIVLATWVATHVLLFWSLVRRQTLTTPDAASHIPMGLPFSFLWQDQAYYYGFEDRLPAQTRFLAPQEFVTHMIWPHYFLDLVLVWGSLLLITLLILWVIQEVRRTRRTGS
jgi:hypothetical protein